MRKITEKEYYKWRDTQSKIDIKVQLANLLLALDEVIVDNIGLMSVKGRSCFVLACYCRFLLEEHGIDVDTKYKWREIFEKEVL